MIRNDLPAASVILPVCNGGRYLDSAIRSVIGQSFSDFEVLLLNDGSTDDSLSRLEWFAARDSRCRVFSWPNRGLIGTLNEGIRLARSEILIRMDSDDICHATRFQKQIDYLNANPDCVAVGTLCSLIDPEGLPIRTFVEVTSHEAIDAAHLAGNGGNIAHPTVAMRKSLVLACGGYRDQFPHAEDLDLFLRLAEVGRLANLPEVLLDYRQHRGSIGYRHAEVQRDSARRAVAEAKTRRGHGGEEKEPEEGCTSSDMTIAAVHRKWGWWALAGRNLPTARKHAFIALRLQPFESENWKLIACVFRGY
jgi:glycosyltransferase involved in cell wall biosynthesis